MEGIAYEAASLAGHLKLGKLIYLYDDNRISLAASTDISFSEDRARRFEACGWHTITVEDGNDLESIEHAIRSAQAESRRPSLILVRTQIGFGSPHKQGSFESHGSPLGAEEVKLTKQNLGWPAGARVLCSRRSSSAISARRSITAERPKRRGAPVSPNMPRRFRILPGNLSS